MPHPSRLPGRAAGAVTLSGLWRRRRALGAAALLLAPVLVRAQGPAGAPPPATPLAVGQPRTFVAREVMLPEGKVAAVVPEAQRHLFKVVEDEGATGGQALEVKVDKRLILANTGDRAQPDYMPIVRLPDLDRATAPTGLYRISARVKIDGMLNVIGTGIRFSARGGTPSLEPGCQGTTLYGFMFPDTDGWHEFSFTTEVVPPDHVTGRPLRPPAQGALGAYPGTRQEIEKRRQFPDGTPEEKQARAEQEKRRAEEMDRAFAHGALGVELAFNENATHGFGRVYNTLQAVRVDWVRVERLPEPAPVVVRQVLPQKVWLRPGTEQQFHVWLHNRSGQEQRGRLRVRVLHGLADVIPVTEQELTLADGAYRVVSLPWTPAAGRDLWGCSVQADWLMDGQPRSAASESFSVHANPWAVMNFGGATPALNPYHKPIDYRNYMEFFGIAPGDAGKPFPDDPALPYFTGMSNYMTHVDLQKRIVEHNRAIGVGTFMYMSPLVTGLHAQELYLKHPEWFMGRIDWSDLANDQWLRNTRDMLERWESGRAPPTREEGLWQFYHIEVPINAAFPEVLDNLIDGLKKNLRHVGYDGIRWDGGPIVVQSVERHGIKAGPGDHEADMRECADKIRRIKRELRQEFPAYTEGNNGTPYGEMASLYKRTAPPPELDKLPAFVAFLDDGSSLMDEGWMSAYGYMDPRNIIKDYFWGARAECDACRRAGGFLHTFSPERDGNPYFTISTIYYNLLVALAGAQYPGHFSNTPGSETGTTQFLTRFSEFLWDNRLMWERHARDLIRVDAPVDLWYDETVVARDLPDGRRRLVIPLVNPPPNERFYTDRFSELPEPVTEPFPVEIRMPEGFNRATVTMLTAEPRTAAVPLPAEVDGGLLRFDVPGIRIYRVLVVEMAK